MISYARPGVYASIHHFSAFHMNCFPGSAAPVNWEVAACLVQDVKRQDIIIITYNYRFIGGPYGVEGQWATRKGI